MQRLPELGAHQQCGGVGEQSMSGTGSKSHQGERGHFF